MNATFERHTLELEEPFTIARGTQETVENVVVRIEDDGEVGLGAAAPSTHYGETADTVEAVLPRLFEALDRLDSPLEFERAHAEMAHVINDNPAAKAAVDIALHDLAAKQLGVPGYRLLGLDPAETVTSSFTVGLADTPAMRRKAEDAVAAGYDTLKVKLGTGHDLKIMDAIRTAAPDATVRVDANEAWSPREAVSKIEALVAYDVEFVEQPVAAENHEGCKYVYERAALPIAADESCLTATDIPRVAEMADIANAKLMKTGGVRPAVKLLHTAKAHGLETMLGCMIETNLAIAAGVHLSPLLDYADLDGSLLLADDPYGGPTFEGGHIDLTDVTRPGLGTFPRE
ncbi:dipeptide epimerase [Natronomonas sp. EA1]|uniref:dipeptide epimerase n=1 Tax=Natronomonas sp. EA1 TaxID=3421655 RepID=UPI003EB96994